MANCKFLVAGIIIFLATTLHVALSENIECYQCVIDGEGPCRNALKDSNLTVSCPHSCITHTFSIGGKSSKEKVVRVCAPPDYCGVGIKLLESQGGIKTQGCELCNTNLCNAPPPATTVTTDDEPRALSENIECYQCVTEGEGACRNVQNDRNLTVSCPHSCITHTMAPLAIGRGNSGEMVARVCSTTDYCEIGTEMLETQLGLKTRGCVSCNTNLCNAPPTTTAAVITATESRALSENIECYYCVSDGEGPCRNPQNEKNLTVSCPNSCITHTIAPLSIRSTSSREIVTRVCAAPDYCEIGTKLLETHAGLKTLGCVVCNTNLCNAPPTTTTVTTDIESKALSENIECYQCLNDGEGPCKNVQNDKNLTVSCPHSCITHTMAPLSIGRGNSGEIIARVCSTPDYCEVGTQFLETQLGLKTRGCVSCNTNLCNAPRTTTAAETTNTESRALSENINCYQCVQDGEGPCTNAQKDNNLTVSCQHSCITHTVALSIRGMSSKEIVTRVCATSDYCEIGTKLLETQAGLKTLGCVACNTNLCNAPPTTTTVTTDIESRAVPGNIECYQCVNDGEGPCKNALNDKNVIVNCPHSCITHTLDPLSIGGIMSSGEIVARVCSSPDYCEMGTKMLETQLGLKTRGCVACNTNRCNAPPTTTAAITTDIESTATENIECYVCVSENGKQCRDTHNNINPTSSCPHSCITHTVARITSGAANSGGMVFRLCSSPDFCEVGAELLERHMDFKTLGCVSCNSSLCNAPSATISP